MMKLKTRVGPGFPLLLHYYVFQYATRVFARFCFEAKILAEEPNAFGKLFELI